MRVVRSVSAVHFSRRFIAICAAIVVLGAGSVTYALAAGVVHTSSGWYTCQDDGHANVAHSLIVRNNGGQPMCIGSSNWNDDFTVQHSSVTRNWANYPNIYEGCEYEGANLKQLCTSGYTPPRVSSVTSDTAYVSYYYPQTGFRGNTAYDIWFDKSAGVPTGRDNGTEVMIWLGTKGLGSPVYYRKVEIDGIWWGYDAWRAGTRGPTQWNYVRYWRLKNWTPHSMATLNLVPFFRDAERMGRLSSYWYLTGTEYGFETCYGGRGLQVRNFIDDIVGPRKFLGSLQHQS